MFDLIKLDLSNDLVSKSEEVGRKYFDEYKEKHVMWDGDRAYKNPSLTFYTSMVYGFAKHLPYSMDIEQPEYVPADFLHVEPSDVETNNWFKWEDRRTMFNALNSWGDTYKTSMILQMCYFFQKLLLGEIKLPENDTLTDDDFYNLGFDTLTRNMEYNKNFFNVFREMPAHYKNVISASNNDERRERLEEMYSFVLKNIPQKFAYSILPPDKDVDLLVYNDDIIYWDGIKDVTDLVKNEQLKEYNVRKANRDSRIEEEPRKIR